MKIPTCLTLLCIVLFAGCESPALPERFAAVPPRVTEVDGDLKTVYIAAQKAFKRLDFSLTRATMGRIEAASAINTSEAFGDSRQTVARVVIHETAPGKCAVELSVTEEVSSRSLGGTRRQVVKEHSFYGLYFAMLQQVLQEQAAGATAEKR
jgi:hypothetical protein